MQGRQWTVQDGPAGEAKPFNDATVDIARVKTKSLSPASGMSPAAIILVAVTAAEK
jgi:hypothetical protein